jgi:hypothetical protein
MIKKQRIGMRTRQLVIILLIQSFFISANAEWTIYKRIQQRSKEGHVLKIDTDTNNIIWAWFILKKKTAGVFKSKLPLYQVDNNDVHDFQLIKNKKVKEDRWIRWMISNSKSAPGSDLLELMNGKEATFQYYLPDGTIKETAFDLDGAREAIEEILK